MAPQKLTAYERKRLENIKRNEEMLAALKVYTKAADLSATTKRQRVETKSFKVSPQKKSKPEIPIVVRRSLRTKGMPPDLKVRRSLRTKGMPPDLKGLSDDSVDSVVKASDSVSLEKFSAVDMTGPVSFKDAYAKTGSYTALVDTIFSVARKPHSHERKEELDTSLDYKMKLEVGVSFKEEHMGYCDSTKSTFRTEMSELDICVDLGSFSLKPENIVRITPGKIMQVKFLPCTGVRMVVAGSKMGNVAFWNLDSEQDEDNGIYLYHPHSGAITGIVTQQSCLSKIFTSCHDGLVRLMDAEKEVFDLVYSSEDPIFSLSANNANSLYFGEGQGGLNMWDVRTGKSSTEWLLHEARINTIDFNSQNPNFMATSSTDGTACIWDLRSMSTEIPVKVISHKKAVHAAYFSPSGNILATTSLDDMVGIWSGVNFEDASMIQHNNQTGRWLEPFRAIWGWDDSCIFVGNLSRTVDIISLAQRKIVASLQSPDISAILCRFDVHPLQVGMLAGATGGGQVYVWSSD